MRLGLFLPLALIASSPFAAADYHVDRVFSIGGSGGWDYLAVDATDHLLFVPRVTHTQVVDSRSGRVIADIPGQGHNHGVALAPGAGRGFISDGQNACVWIFDLASYRVLGKIAVADDADGIIYDPASDRVLVACGDASAMIPIRPDVDPAKGAADAAIDLGGKPEFLVSDGRGKVYVNLVDRNLVAAVDMQARKVVARWPVAPGGSPVGMAMDRSDRLLFVGCRKPRQLIVMSADDGRVLAGLPIGAGVDATAFDDGRAFASCRDGTLSVAQPSPAWSIAQVVATRPGARTMGVDSQTRAIYLPTAELIPNGTAKPTPKPDSFMIVVVKP